LEYVWMRRLAPIISHHVKSAQMSTVFEYGSLRGPSHPEWVIQRNDALLKDWFECKEAGEPFVQANGRKMLTLFAKKDGDNQFPLMFFYTGTLCNTMRHQHGRFERVAVAVPQEPSLWIIPPNDFNIDNTASIHAAHFLHQDEKVAHFEFSDHGDQCIFLNQVRAFKAGDRLFCYYGPQYDFHGDEYIKLAPPPAAIDEEGPGGRGTKRGKKGKSGGGGGSKRGRKGKSSAAGRGKRRGRRGAGASDDDGEDEDDDVPDNVGSNPGGTFTRSGGQRVGGGGGNTDTNVQPNHVRLVQFRQNEESSEI